MKAFVVRETDGHFSCGVHEHEATALNDADVLVAVEFSSVNFKDALVAVPESRVRRVGVLVGGVDAAGVVEEANPDSPAVGTRVAVHGGDLGVGRDGGFAPYCYAPRRYLSELPDALSTYDAMVIGTAGYTAMASVLALEDHGLAPGAEVLVTGASGGVGSQAVTFLALRGYRPVASTGSSDHVAWLLERGATRVIGRDELSDRPARVLASERWDGAIDCVGGDTLAQILRSLRYGGTVAASGLVAGAELATTVYPFITRAVALVGVDAVEASPSARERVWTALGEIAPRIAFTDLVDRTVTIDQLPQALDDIRRGATRGRIVVRFSRHTDAA